MFGIPQSVTTVSHPLVRHMYRRGASLVIETTLSESDRDDEDFDLSLLDLLTDLKDLKARAEDEVGSFDQVDIRLN